MCCSKTWLNVEWILFLLPQYHNNIETSLVQLFTITVKGKYSQMKESNCGSLGNCMKLRYLFSNDTKPGRSKSHWMTNPNNKSCLLDILLHYSSRFVNPHVVSIMIKYKWIFCFPYAIFLHMGCTAEIPYLENEPLLNAFSECHCTHRASMASMVIFFTFIFSWFATVLSGRCYPTGY